MNEWNVTNGSLADYQDFGRVQLDIYNAASFGWSYWTLKCEKKHWDFEWSIRNNYLQLQPGIKLTLLASTAQPNRKHILLNV